MSFQNSYPLYNKPNIGYTVNMAYQETETHITLTCDKCGKVQSEPKAPDRNAANLRLYMSGWRIKYVDRKDGNHYCGEVCLHALKMVR